MNLLAVSLEFILHLSWLLLFSPRVHLFTFCNEGLNDMKHIELFQLLLKGELFCIEEKQKVLILTEKYTLFCDKFLLKAAQTVRNSQND